MTAIVIILAIIAIWLIFAPYIRPWLQRRAEQKLADYLRRQMGMPTEKEQRQAEKNARNRRNAAYGTWTNPAGHQNTRSRHPADEPLIPKEYAVDVEYTEIREFAQTVIKTIRPSQTPRPVLPPNVRSVMWNILKSDKKMHPIKLYTSLTLTGLSSTHQSESPGKRPI